MLFDRFFYSHFGRREKNELLRQPYILWTFLLINNPYNKENKKLINIIQIKDS